MGKKRKVKGFWASLFEPTPVKHTCSKPNDPIVCWCGYAPDREMRP